MQEQVTRSDQSQDPSGLELALEKSESVENAIQQSATELLVINAVLQQEIPAHAQSGDVAQALVKNDQIENRLQQSAEDLAEVNRALEREIDEREQLERELEQAKAQLAEAESR